MFRLGVQTAGWFAPRQYALRNTMPLFASASRFGVLICGFPSAAIVSAR